MKPIFVTHPITLQKVDDIATGQRVREERIARKMSVREVAKRMKISAPYLSDLERGRRNWNEMLVRRFAKAARIILPVKFEPDESFEKEVKA